MRLLDSASRTARPSMLLQGLTGSGKSTWACTGGKPLVILTEPKAESVLHSLNPQAVGIVPESLDDLEQLFAILGNPDRLAARKIDRIVLDSYTELTHAIPRWIRQRAGLTGVLQRIELQQYGELRDYAMALVRAIQLTGYPSVIIARSTTKRVGLVERIVPDGTGRSTEELPGKLLPTAEARFDLELGWVLDTTPSESSQRCGLPWVPPVYAGDILEYLRIVEAGPQGATPTPEPKPRNARERKPVPPGADDVEWVALLVELGQRLPEGCTQDYRKAVITEWEARASRDLAEAKDALVSYLEAANREGMKRLPAPDPEQDPEGYRLAFGKACEAELAEKRANKPPVSPEAAAFVDAVSPVMAKPEDVTELLDLARDHKVNTDALWRYAVAQGGAPAGAKCPQWPQLGADFTAKVGAALKDTSKREKFISFLTTKHGKA